jgi:hypothetical protein
MPFLQQVFGAVWCLGVLFLAAGSFLEYRTPDQADAAARGRLPIVVDGVRIEGCPELADSEKTLLAEGLRGESAHLDWVERLKAKATRGLQNDGFLDAQVTAQVESERRADTKEHVTVSLTLSCGARYSIKQIWWTGSSVFPPTQLNNFTLLRVGDIFRPSALLESDSLLRQVYKERGYEEMFLLSQLQKFPEKGYVTLYLEVREGPKSELKKQVSCKKYSTEEIQRSPYVPSLTYNPTVELQMQIARAQLEAQQLDKKLLLIVGGEWCGWCRVLDQTFERNQNLKVLRDRTFIVVYVDAAEEDNLACVLRPYTRPSSFPFLYVLNETGILVGTEDTVDWESSDGYDPTRIEFFLRKW